MNVNDLSEKTVITTGMISPGLFLRPRVELLAELHDVHALLTEGGADRRRGIRLAGGDLQLDKSDNLFHDSMPFCNNDQSIATFPIPPG